MRDCSSTCIPEQETYLEFLAPGLDLGAAVIFGVTQQREDFYFYHSVKKKKKKKKLKI